MGTSLENSGDFCVAVFHQSVPAFLGVGTLGYSHVHDDNNIKAFGIVAD